MLEPALSFRRRIFRAVRHAAPWLRKCTVTYFRRGSLALPKLSTLDPRWVMLALALSPVFYFWSYGLWGYDRIDPPPRDRPAVLRREGGCEQIAGTYADPSWWRPRWDAHASFQGSPYGPGWLEAAWAAFSIASNQLRVQDPNVKSRHFTLNFNVAGDMQLVYFIDGENIAKQIYSAETIRCGSDGVVIAIHDYIGGYVHNAPSYGIVKSKLILNKCDGVLYAKRVDRIVGLSLWFIPWFVDEINWHRFPVLQQPEKVGFD